MPEDAIDIRPLRTNDECYAAAALQREVWGQDYIDVVPATLLHVVDYVGGLAAGAFDGSGDLCGFVFGINGVRDGEIVHWSHMLGVRESARNLGLGRRLKEFQCDTLRAIGVQRIFWTFDPLMAKNAYFNLDRLGAEVVEYVPDMYGTTTSPLHLGMATDRLIVSLQTARDRSGAPRRTPGPETPVLTAFPRPDDAAPPAGDRSPRMALIEIPTNVLAVLAESPTAARTWRHSVREHLQWALSRGYIVTGVYSDPDSERSFYVVVQGPPVRRCP